MQVYNVMEEIVRNEITNNLGQLNMSCTCDYCLSDVLAISLNDLPPRYIVDQKQQPACKGDACVGQAGNYQYLKDYFTGSHDR